MKKLLTLLFLGATTYLLGQSLKVTYDFKTQAYTVDGNRKVRKGEQINLEIININTLLFRITAEAKSEEFQVSSDGALNLSALLSSSNSWNTLKGLIGGEMDFSNSVSEENYSFEVGGKGGLEANAAALEQVRLTTASIKSQEKKVEKLYEKLNQIAHISDAVKIAQSEIQFLRNQVDVSVIKEEVAIISKMVFDDEVISNIDINSLLSYKNLKQQAILATQ